MYNSPTHRLKQNRFRHSRIECYISRAATTHLQAMASHKVSFDGRKPIP